jgi:hypothetical protein
MSGAAVTAGTAGVTDAGAVADVVAGASGGDDVVVTRIVDFALPVVPLIIVLDDASAGTGDAGFGVTTGASDMTGTAVVAAAGTVLATTGIGDVRAAMLVAGVSIDDPDGPSAGAGAGIGTGVGVDVGTGEDTIVVVVAVIVCGGTSDEAALTPLT